MLLDSLVWIPHEEEGFVKGIVKNISKSKGTVKLLDSNEILEVHVDNITLIHGEEKLANVDNLTNILDLNSPNLLEALQERFYEQKIYTYTGQVVIAINPFQRIKSLYSKETLQFYLDSKEKRNPLPHAFAVADSSYRSMIENQGRNQSVLVSGESGSGKTETTKIVLNYLTTISTKNRKSESEVCKAVLQTNELLESFGNARTVRNDNSSRFGKLIQLQFSPTKHDLIGATIDTYLLEKARITHQSSGERNFHIFYELCSGCTKEEKSTYLLPDLADCEYTNGSGLYKRLDVSDKEQFKKTLHAMKIVGVTEKERTKVFNIVSSVLHLGNIQFTNSHNEDSTFADDARTKTAISSICSLLKLDKKFLKQALCTRSITTGSKGVLSRVTGAPEVVYRQHNVLEASEARDALAMTLYHRLFYWIVWKINLKVGEVGQEDDIRRRLSDRLEKLNIFTEKEKKNKKLKNDALTYIKDFSIGCLDIFGFEVFERNSFEQLCINYANEVLQQHFNTCVFKDEQIFYQSEGINWKNIEFPDNLECIKMIEGTKKSVGLLKLIDEECMYPKGSDKSLHAKLFKHLAVELDMKKEAKQSKKNLLVSNSFIRSTRSGRLSVDFRTQKRQLKFSICHFAGDVEYNVNGFYAKNKDELRREAVGLLRGSKDSLVKKLVPADAMNGPQDSTSAGKYFQELHDRAKRKGRKRSLLMRGSLERHFKLDLKQSQRIQQKTVGKQFKEQLYQAMKHIRSSEPHYVRCIKPNDIHSPVEFNRQRVLEQLNYSGVLEVVRVARAGYSTRFSHFDFLGRFQCIAQNNGIELAKTHKQKSQKKSSVALLSSVKNLVKGVDYEVGNTMTMFRSEGYIKLESLRQQLLLKYVIVIQRWYRKELFRIKRTREMRSAILIQSIIRAYIVRKKVSKFRKELAEKRRVQREKERKIKEAEEKRRLQEEKEKLRLLEIARLEAERIREEEERIEAEKQAKIKLQRETEAAIVLQSFFRVLLAQKEANKLYEAKLEQEMLLNEAANVIIDLFREIVRKKKFKRAKEKADAELIKQLEREEEEANERKLKRKALKQQRKKKEAKKKAEAVTSLFENLVSLAAPICLIFLLSNPRMLFIVLFFGLALAAGATFTVSAKQRKDYLKRKKKRRVRKKRESASTKSMTNKTMFVKGRGYSVSQSQSEEDIEVVPFPGHFKTKRKKRSANAVQSENIHKLRTKTRFGSIQVKKNFPIARKKKSSKKSSEFMKSHGTINVSEMQGGIKSSSRIKNFSKKLLKRRTGLKETDV